MVRGLRAFADRSSKAAVKWSAVEIELLEATLNRHKCKVFCKNTLHVASNVRH